jgi:iron complex outermembrane receptor protein
VNVDTRFRFHANLAVYARINNLFDRTYANFGTLGRNVLTGPNNTFDGINPRYEQFLGYGAPRGALLGLRYSWS